MGAKLTTREAQRIPYQKDELLAEGDKNRYGPASGDRRRCKLCSTEYNTYYGHLCSGAGKVEKLHGNEHRITIFPDDVNKLFLTERDGEVVFVTAFHGDYFSGIMFYVEHTCQNTGNFSIVKFHSNGILEGHSGNRLTSRTSLNLVHELRA